MRSAFLPPHALLLSLALGFLTGCGGTTVHSTKASVAVERAVEQVDLPREQLGKSADLATCRLVLRAQTAAQSRPDAPRPPAADEPLLAFLRDPRRFGLDAGSVGEVESGSYTLLDERYLEACLLFRDAARALEVDDRPLPEKASAAFAWICRQLRSTGQRSDSIPPDFALRRGWGMPLDRAFAFLALMRQLGVEACLLGYPVPGKDDEYYQVCGVPTEDGKDLYLFDPALGLPLPGPGGQGIGTLASVKKQEHVLQQFAVGPAFQYKGTPAKILLACPLSSLAPRLKYLQDEVLGPAVNVKLAVEPRGLMTRYQTLALAQGIPETAVEFWRDATTLRRSFLTSDEGGVDRGGIALTHPALAGYVSRQDAADPAIACNRMQFFFLSLTPWRLMPAGLRELQYRTEIGQRPRTYLIRLCATFYVEPRGPRDYILRGRLDEAAASLPTQREELKDQRERYLRDNTFDKRIAEWAAAANDAYLAVRRAENSPGAEAGSVEAAKERLELYLKEGEKTWGIGLDGITADFRTREVGYQLALCMHELAQRRQDRSIRPGATESEKQAAQEAWTTAASWWDTFASEYPTVLENYPYVPAAATVRRLRALAHLAQGEKKLAVTLLEDATGVANPLELAARQYLAKQVK